MKLMRVASMALAAYLVSSALFTSVTMRRSWFALERRVQSPHEVDGLVVLGADDDAVGPHEVLDRRTFLQEFRVGDDAVGIAAPRLANSVGNGRLDLVGGAHRHRALVHDHLVVGHQAPDVAGCREDVLEVGRAVFVGGVPTAMNWMVP